MCRITELIIERAGIWPAHGYSVTLRGRRQAEEHWEARYSPEQLERIAQIDAELARLHVSARPSSIEPALHPPG